MKFDIRPALVSDAEQIAAIQVKCWQERLSAWAPDWFVKQFKQQAQASKYAERIASNVYGVLVAEQNEQILGFSAIKPNLTDVPEYPYQIAALYVDPLVERQGIGKALLQETLQLTDDGKMIVWTFRDNTSSRKLYEACGGKLLPYTQSSEMDLDIPHVSYGWP